MLRHFQLFATAPGRDAEAEAALCRWLEAVATAREFRGGAVLREYAGEFGEVEGALAVMYDVESREASAEFRRATADVPNPMGQDVPGEEPPDQGAVLFMSGGAHSHDHNGDHDSHGHGDGHGSGSDLAELRYDRGGGLLARLMHGHFTVVTSHPPTTTVSTRQDSSA